MEQKPLAGLNTRSLGRTLIRLERVSSTNDYGKERVGTLPDGAVIVTQDQYAGKGRRGKVWSDDPGAALYLSAVFHALPLTLLPLLPLACGLAAVRGIGELTKLPAGIKWPNDVVTGGKKLAGILCEGVTAEGICHVVCGIGVNLTQSREDFCKRQLPYAASLQSETGREFSADETAAAFLNHLEPLINLLKTQGFLGFREDYAKACVTLNRQVRVAWEGREQVGEAVGIAPDGALLCRIQGEIVPIHSGEASVRGLYGYL